MVALVGGIATGLAVFIVGAAPSLAYLREMVWIFPITAVATIVFIVVGTAIFPDSPPDRAEVDAFFDKLSATPKEGL